MNDYNFGNFVCSLREKCGLTQADLAQQLDVTPAAISKWENGSSKPRVEVLFRLAEILGVRPEELMAGRHLEEDHLDPESVRMINEKYEHLRRIELHNTSATKIFRLIAWVIDWNLIGLMTLFAIAFSMGFIGEFNNSLPAPFALFLILLILSYPICFILRDLIFGGRSIGKRIMGLTLLDISTGKAPKKISLILRNIFLQIVEVECIILLITGRTLGDRAAHTVVIRKKDMEPRKEESSTKQNIKKINQYAASRTECAKSNKKRRALWIGIVIAAAVLFMGGIFLYLRTVMNQTKESEEYKLAYSYVITSKSFDELDIEESRLKFSSYSLRSYKDEDNETRYDAEIIFKAGFWKELSVTLHNDGNGWYVCEECTDFE